MAVTKNFSAIKNSPKHLLGIQNLSILDAKKILNEAKTFIKLNRSKSKNSSGRNIVSKKIDYGTTKK